MNVLLKKLSIILLVVSFSALTGVTANAAETDEDKMIMIDLQTERAVIRAINSDAQLASYPIIVGCVDGIITLHGNVETVQERNKVEMLAKTVEGVKSVRTNITTSS